MMKGSGLPDRRPRLGDASLAESPAELSELLQFYADKGKAPGPVASVEHSQYWPSGHWKRGIAAWPGRRSAQGGRWSLIGRQDRRRRWRLHDRAGGPAMATVLLPERRPDGGYRYRLRVGHLASEADAELLGSVWPATGRWRRRRPCVVERAGGG